MSESEGSGAGQREVAYRIFAAEFETADYDYSESDEERAPNYVITPTGARANRLFVVGVLTEIEQVSEDVLRARVVDPTGAFVLYAGQYQPDEQAFLEGIEPPTFVAVTGKARTFRPEDSDQVFTSIRPESISEVDAETRDRWTVQTAEQTVDRVRWMTTALTLDADDLRAQLRERGADDGLAHGIELALDHYGTTPTYLDGIHGMALDAARTVAGELDEVGAFGESPGADGDVTVADLAAKLTLPTDGESDSAVSGGDVGEQSAEPTADATTATDSSSAAAADESAGGSTAEDSASTTEQTEEAEETVEEPATDSSPSTETTESATEMAETPVEDDGPAGATEPADAAGGDTEESTGADDLGDFEPEEFELEEETREEIEAEYGTEFQSGTEVDEPGSADIETPDPEELDAEAEPAESDGPASRESAAGETQPAGDDSTVAEPSGVDDTGPGEFESASETEPEGETDPAGGDEAVSEDTGSESGDADGEDATADADETVDDPQQAVVDLMGELDDGDGAERTELIAEMGDRYGLDSEAVEEAIQSALMDGQCYEPDDETLKPI